MSLNSTAESGNLDFLRSVAVGAVLFDHFGFQTGHPQYGAVGRAGVLLFFVHTALVLMFSLERLNSRGGSPTVPFYIQRFFRIYPLCWFLIVVVILFQIPQPLVGLPYRWGGWGWLFRNLLLIQNFTFSSFVSGPLWSLPYEVQMYIALPFIYQMARKRQALWSISAVWIGSAMSASILARLYGHWYGPNYDDSLHSPVTYFVPCFLGGVFAFILSKRKHFDLTFAVLPPALFGFIALIFYVPFRHADWVGCTALGVLLPQISEFRSKVFGRIFHNIAKYSYGVYLSHTPLLWLVFSHFPGVPDFLRWIIFAGLLAMVPVACYWWIEKPMIDIGRKFARRLAGQKRSISMSEAAAASAPPV